MLNGFSKLTIENFQSHRHTVVHFSKGLNVFVGPSDSGKSAILRALRWLLFNVPRGSDFIHKGASECRVSLTCCDGTEIVRLRSASANRYILRTPDGEEKVFEGFGNEVPQEVVDVHQIHSLKMDQKEMLVHFGTQLESPFLLFESPGSKAKTMGYVSGAYLIDRALKKASVDRQNTNAEIKRLEKEVASLDEKLLPYQDVDEIEKRFLLAEKKFHFVEQRQERLDRLRQLVVYLHALQKERSFYLAQVAKKENLMHVDRVLHDLEKCQWRYTKLVRLADAQRETKQGMDQCKQWMKTCERLPNAEKALQQMDNQLRQYNELVEWDIRWSYLQKELFSVRKIVSCHQSAVYVQNHLQTVDGKQKRLYLLAQFHKQWTDVNERLSRGRRFKEETHQALERLSKQWEKLLKTHPNCPVCGGYLQDSTIEEVVQEHKGRDDRATAGGKHSAN